MSDNLNIRSIGVKKMLSKEGRLQLPNEFRKILGVEPYDEVELFLTDKGVLVTPVYDEEKTSEIER